MTTNDKETVYINESVKKIDRLIIFIVGCIISFTLGIFAGITHERYKTIVPVENNTTIDSLTTINDSIKIKIEKLDSIKNAKVIEVSTLDNDSTLKLFYKLVSE